MSAAVRETACTACVHCEVCSKKETFLKAVDNILVCLGDRTTVSLSSIDFIHVELKCKHYKKNGPTVRMTTDELVIQEG